MAEEPETRETRLKRLRLRSWRRGTREMDLLLGGFADGALDRLDEGELAAYEDLLEVNDNELYDWISGRDAPALPHADLVARIRAHHGIADASR